VPFSRSDTEEEEEPFNSMDRKTQIDKETNAWRGMGQDEEARGQGRLSWRCGVAQNKGGNLELVIERRYKIGLG